MKKTIMPFTVLALSVALIAVGCGSSPEGGDAAVSDADFAAPAAGPFFTGDGGDGMTLTILAPEGKNTAADDAYLPELVQSVLTEDFSRYSAISVTNWANLTKVLKQAESAVYAENADVLEAGKITATQYIASGSLTKSGGGFLLQITITDTKTKTSKAAYTANCTGAELANMSAIRKASADLLPQMGVSLNDAGKKALGGAAGKGEISSQTALARGAAAARLGQMAEAMGYYFEAGATERLAVLAATDISSGNLGSRLRDDVAQRNEWVKVVADCNAYFLKNSFWEVVYDPKVYQTGKTDYEKGTVNLAFLMELRPLKTAFDIIDGINAGLESTGRRAEWGLGSLHAAYNEDYSSVVVTADLYNSANKHISNGIGYVGAERIDLRQARQGEVVFKDIDANAITEDLTIKIDSVSHYLDRGPYLKKLRPHFNVSTGSLRIIEDGRQWEARGSPNGKHNIR